MLLDEPHGMLIEVFAKTSKSKGLEGDVLKSGRLFQPLTLTGGDSSLKIWRWTVVRSDPGYKGPTSRSSSSRLTPRAAPGAPWTSKETYCGA